MTTVPAPLAWTPDPPQKEGWYWVRKVSVPLDIMPGRFFMSRVGAPWMHPTAWHVGLGVVNRLWRDLATGAIIEPGVKYERWPVPIATPQERPDLPSALTAFIAEVEAAQTALHAAACDFLGSEVQK